MMRRAAEELLRFRPAYVLGYSVALDLFAAANRDRREQLRASGVRLVVGTAEAFPTRESANRLRDLFGCDVAMEYGAVETGLLAHTHPEGGYRAFWRSYLLEVAGGEHPGRLLVTSLYPRCLPLVRYEIGDEIYCWRVKYDTSSSRRSSPAETFLRGRDQPDTITLDVLDQQRWLAPQTVPSRSTPDACRNEHPTMGQPDIRCLVANQSSHGWGIVVHDDQHIQVRIRSAGPPCS